MKETRTRRWGLGLLIPALLVLPGISGLITGQTWIPAMRSAFRGGGPATAAGGSGKQFALAWLLAALVTHLEFFWKEQGSWPGWLAAVQKVALALFVGGLLWTLLGWMAQSLSA